MAERAANSRFFRSPANKPSFSAVPDNGKEKGKTNLNRAFRIFQELVAGGAFLRVRRTTKKQGREGIDLIAVVDVNQEEVSIPFKVESSVGVATEFINKSIRDNIRDIQIVVVNDGRDDRSIKNFALYKTRGYLIRRKQRLAEVAEVVNALV